MYALQLLSGNTKEFVIQVKTQCEMDGLTFRVHNEAFDGTCLQLPVNEIVQCLHAAFNLCIV